MPESGRPLPELAEGGRTADAEPSRVPKLSASARAPLRRMLKDPSPSDGGLWSSAAGARDLGRDGDLLLAEGSGRSLDVHAATMFRTDVKGERAILRRAAVGRVNDPWGVDGRGAVGVGGATARGGRVGLDSFGGGGGGTTEGNGRPDKGLDGEPGRDFTGETGLGDGFVGDVGRDDDRDCNVVERGNGEVVSSRGVTEIAGTD